MGKQKILVKIETTINAYCKKAAKNACVRIVNQ